MLLKHEGGWKTLSMVERYAHLMPSEFVGDISQVWGDRHPAIGLLPQRSNGEESAHQQRTAEKG